MKAVAAGRQESSLQSQNREDAERRNKKESKKEKKKETPTDALACFACIFRLLVCALMRFRALCALCAELWAHKFFFVVARSAHSKVSLNSTETHNLL